MTELGLLSDKPINVKGVKVAPHRTDKFEGFVPTMGGISVWINAWSVRAVSLVIIGTERVYFYPYISPYLRGSPLS